MYAVPSSLILSLALALPAAAGPAVDVHQRAEELLEEGRAGDAAELLAEHLARSTSDPECQELYGRALAKLDRRDEAAHWLATAADSLELRGNERQATRLRRDLQKLDPLNRKRTSALSALARDLLRSTDRLLDEGQVQRAAELLSRATPLAREAGRLDEAEELARELARITEAVDLDGEGEATDGEGSSTTEVESDHYVLVSKLEPEVARLLAVTMDDVHEQYVQVFFGGNGRRAPRSRPRIYLHESFEALAAAKPDGAVSPGLRGWWSPSDGEIHALDERSLERGLAGTLHTLYHEASHQFMADLTGGAGVPTWLNEGTATFFEGSTAMADGRVLWPDAEPNRLAVLVRDLRASPQLGPRLEELLAFPGPGSYPATYYAHGWGLVYFLQQWTDEDTGDYAYRPLYRAYLEDSKGRPEKSVELFEEHFLGKASPLAHQTLGEFEQDWHHFILEELAPLHLSPSSTQRSLRMERAWKWIAASEGASDRARPGSPSRGDLLLRAHRDLEFVRSELDPPEQPRQDVLEALASVLEQLGRDEAAAAMIERLLDGADAGWITLEPGRYSNAVLDLERLDRSNGELRKARASEARNADRLADLLDEYAEREPDLILRAYTLASRTSRALGEPEEWVARTEALRVRADELGRLLSAKFELAADRTQWLSMAGPLPDGFEPTEGTALLDVTRPAGVVDKSLELSGRYLIGATVRYVEEPGFSGASGLVVSGGSNSDWIFVGVDADGAARVWRLFNEGGGVSQLRSIASLSDQSIDPETSGYGITILRNGRTLSISINDKPASTFELPLELPQPTHAGVYGRDGAFRFERLTVEILP